MKIMNTIDKIRSYITQERSSRRLHPGDQLPNYRQLMKITNASYATVASAMYKLQKHGLVEISKGNGSFLAGGNELVVRFNTDLTNVPLNNLQKMFDRHFSDLNIRFDIQPVDALKNEALRVKLLNEDQPTIYLWKNHNLFMMPISRLCNLPGYDDLLAIQIFQPNCSFDFALPMVRYSFQLGINGKLLKKSGLKIKDITSDFNWWGHYLEGCQKYSFCPASCLLEQNGFNAILSFIQLLLAMTSFDPSKFLSNKPLFDTVAGRKMLQIARDCNYYKTANSSTFFRGGSGMNFMTGNWIATQNKTTERPDINIDDLIVVPYQCAGQKLHYMDVEYLSAYLPEHLSASERIRIWDAVKIMLSYPFQADYCSAAGMLSILRDFNPADYRWNNDEYWNVFIPQKNDLIIRRNDLFPEPVVHVLSSLLETFLFYNSDIDTVAKRMDEAKNIENN